MYGYYVSFGYRGWVPWLKRYLEFATEQDYKEYLEDR